MENRFKEAFNTPPPQSEFVIETVNDNDILGANSGFSFTDDLTAAANTAAPDNGSTFFTSDNGQKSNLNIGDMVTGAFVINAIDNVLPAVTVAGFKLMDVSINKKDLQLTADEKRFLEPPMDDYLKTLNIRLSPLESVLLAFGTVYVGKAATIYSNISKGSTGTGRAGKDLNSTNEGAIKKPRKKRSDAGTTKS